MQSKQGTEMVRKTPKKKLWREKQTKRKRYFLGAPSALNAVKLVKCGLPLRLRIGGTFIASASWHRRQGAPR